MDKRRTIIICIFCSMFLLFGCAKDYRKLSRGKSIKQKSYSLSDSLFVSDYIFFNRFNSAPLPKHNITHNLDSDSVMQVLVSSMNQVGIPVQDRIHEGKKHVDSTFLNKYVVRMRRVNDEWIKEVAGDTQGVFKLVPHLFILNRKTFHAYITSGGMAGDSGFSIITFLNLIVYIVHDNEIIYSSQALHASDLARTDTRWEVEALPPAMMVTEENWQELARIALEDYMKRLK